MPRNEFWMIWVIFLMPTDHVMVFLCFITDNQLVGMSGQVGEVWGGQFLVKNMFVLKCLLEFSINFFFEAFPKGKVSFLQIFLGPIITSWAELGQTQFPLLPSSAQAPAQLGWAALFPLPQSRRPAGHPSGKVSLALFRKQKLSCSFYPQSSLNWNVNLDYNLDLKLDLYVVQKLLHQK